QLRHHAARHCHLLRDVVGNPFRPMEGGHAWLTSDVVTLGKACHAGRALPSGELESANLVVLADALEEVGCTAADILTHLRSPGPHVWGCWAVDLCISKT